MRNYDRDFSDQRIFSHGAPEEQPGERRKRGGKGGRHGTDSLIQSLLNQHENTHLLFVGSLYCIRHNPFSNVGELMRNGRCSVLCPSMSDFATGRYLKQIEEAVVELSQEYETKHFALIHGCQWVILSTDGDYLKATLKDQYGIELTIKDDSHLIKGDHA